MHNAIKNTISILLTLMSAASLVIVMQGKFFVFPSIVLFMAAGLFLLINKAENIK